MFALVVPIKHVLFKKVYKKLNFFYFNTKILYSQGASST